MASRIVVLISGSGSNLQAIMDSCEKQGSSGKVVGVISNKGGAFGLERAQKKDIPTTTLSHTAFESREDYDCALIEAIDLYKPDLVVLAGFMRILTPHFVEHFQGRLINIHPSLLPKYQGLNTHQRAIDAGDKEHGVSVHFVTETLDGGPVILQAKVPVYENDTADEVAARVHVQEHRIYPLVVEWFCQNRLEMRCITSSNKADESLFEAAILDGKTLPISGYASEL
ncbi:MAG: phosphoribosylglycinamide formyltransferase [Colwellia sp.]